MLPALSRAWQATQLCFFNNASSARAAGARQSVEDVIAVNCRTEILFGSLGGAQPATECTTVVALPEATRDGGILIEVDGLGSVDDVTARIFAAINA